MFSKPAILLFAAIASARAQQSTTVEGTATDALTGELLDKVTVRLNRWLGDGPAYTATTDVSGRFHFGAVAAGDYSLQGERAGYGVSMRRTMLHLQAGEKVSGFELKLMRRSVIHGKVLDENGDPILRAGVYAYSASWMRGSRQYFMRGLGRTNDTGEYQLSGLEPGRYFLYVNSESERFVEQQGGPEKRLLPVFYPESQTLQNAAPVEVLPGHDLQGINFRLHTGTVFHIRGKIETADLVRQREQLAIDAIEPALIWGIQDLDSGIEKDGSFDIESVPPGSYDVEVLDGRYHLAVATIPVEVKASDVNGIKFVLPSRFELKGTVRLLGSEDAIFSGMEVTASDVRGMMGQPYIAPVQPDGTFQLAAVWPGKYFVNVSIKDQEDYVKSILYDGAEVLGLPMDLAANAGETLQVILAKGAGQVEGTVQTAEKDKLGGYNVVLISERGALFSAADQNGHFSFKGIAPGRYRAFASSGAEPGLWQSPEFSSQFSDKGVEVDLPESGHVQIQVPVLAAREIERAIANLPV